MSQMKADRPSTYLAAAAMAFLYRFVKFTAEYTVNYCGADEGKLAAGVTLDTATAAGMGILIAGPHSGPTMKIEAGAAIAAGAPVKPDASGRAVTAGGADVACGRVLEAATAAGDIIEMQWEKYVV